ncbi:hypothetical protein QQF64_023175 [Cirrhinus molitorella]|uniref:Uncharacterized protein n=1 Tax=Cirrhinus molitorella TaxID=172907 RepID=A0ABR3L817_9TELE
MYQVDSHGIPLLDSVPVRQWYRRIPPSEYEVVKTHINQLLEASNGVFLGFVSYYCCFVEGFAKLAAPLHKLVAEWTAVKPRTQTSQGFSNAWTEQCKLIFAELKDPPALFEVRDLLPGTEVPAAVEQALVADKVAPVTQSVVSALPSFAGDLKALQEADPVIGRFWLFGSRDKRP